MDEKQFQTHSGLALTVQFLSEVSEQLSEAASEAEIIELVPPLTVALLGADRASISLVAEDGEHGVVHAPAGIADPLPAGTRFKLAGSNIGEAIRTQRVVRSRPHTDEDTRLRNAGIAQRLVAPLVVDKQAIGTVNIGGKEERNWGENTERLLSHWAAIIASSIGTMRSRQEKDRAAEFVLRNPNPVLRTTADGRIREANDSARALIGEVESVFDAIPQLDRKCITRARVSSEPVRTTVALGNRTFEFDIQPAADRQHAHLYGRDVTEHTRLRAELESARRLEAVGRMAGGIAHDFNNNLMVIRYAVDYLRTQTGEPRILEEINTISAAADNAAQLTRGLLRFSASEPQTLRPMSLNDVLESLGPVLRGGLRENIDLSVERAADLSNCAGDAGQLAQVVMNLVINAGEAMPDGGTLRVVTKDAGDVVVLEVTDTGVGMDEETAASAFEPFFTRKKASGGTGLGLSTVYGIVRQHRGEVSIESELGVGTTVTVQLPVSRAQLEQRKRRPSSTPGNRSLRTLLVEDNNAVRRAIKKMLTSLGCEVTDVPTAEQALERDADDFDFVVTDLVMPGAGGGTVAEHFLDASPDLAVLLVSGYSDTELPASVSVNTRTRFLAKPFSSDEVASAIKKLFRE